MEDLARRLCVNKPAILRKADELNSLLDARAGSSMATLRLSASCRTVMCLDLAAAALGNRIDQRTAVKYSGVSKKTYIGSLRMAESLLGLQASHQIPELACTFGCTDAMPLAQTILKKFATAPVSSGMDCKSDSVHSAVLYVACKKKGIRVSTTKFREAGGVSKAIFLKTVALVQKVADAVKENEIAVSKPEKSSEEEILTEMESVGASVAVKRRWEEEEEEARPDYEEWKKRMLQDCD